MVNIPMDISLRKGVLHLILFLLVFTLSCNIYYQRKELYTTLPHVCNAYTTSAVFAVYMTTPICHYLHLFKYSVGLYSMLQLWERCFLLFFTCTFLRVCTAAYIFVVYTMCCVHG